MQTRQPSSGPDRPERPWQPRFGLRGLMLVMLICSVMAAATSYLVQSARFGRGYQAAFIAITLVAPLLLAALVANVRALILRHRWP